MPEIAPLQVAELTFQQAKKLIELRGEQITWVQMDVTMGRLRTIPVFVVKLYLNIAQIFASTAQTLGIFALAAGL
jgi:hypothetical protein